MSVLSASLTLSSCPARAGRERTVGRATAGGGTRAYGYGDFARGFFGECGFPATLEAHIGMHSSPNARMRSTVMSSASALFGPADHADGTDRETQRESKRRVGATRHVAATSRTDAAESERGGGCWRHQCIGAATDCIAVRYERRQRVPTYWRRCSRLASHVAIDGRGKRSESRRRHEPCRRDQSGAGQWHVSDRFVADCRRHASRLARIDVAERRDLSVIPCFSDITQPRFAPLGRFVVFALPSLPASKPGDRRLPSCASLELP